MAALGDILRETRIARGVSLNEAAAATKIRRSYLEALEKGDFNSLPGGSYRRVFVRTYAAYLGLDPEEMVALLPPTVAPPVRPTATEMERPPGISRAPRAIATLVIAAVSFLALAAVVVIIQLRQSSSTGPAAGVALVLPTATPTPAPTSAAPAVGTPVGAAAATGTRPLQIQVKASDPVWLAVEVDGHTAFTGSLAKGDSRTWDASTRVALRTNDGSKLSVTINGQDKGALGKAGEVIDVEWTVNAQGAVVQQLQVATPQATASPRSTTPASGR